MFIMFKNNKPFQKHHAKHNPSKLPLNHYFPSWILSGKIVIFLISQNPSTNPYQQSIQTDISSYNKPQSVWQKECSLELASLKYQKQHNSGKSIMTVPNIPVFYGFFTFSAKPIIHCYIIQFHQTNPNKHPRQI